MIQVSQKVIVNVESSRGISSGESEKVRKLLVEVLVNVDKYTVKETRLSLEVLR